MVELLLSDKYYDKHWPVIQKLAASDDPEAFEMLKKYALEAYRLNTPAFGLLRIASSATTISDGKRTVNVAEGSQVFVDFVNASRDPEKFPMPDDILLDRPEEDYLHHGYGPHACLGRRIVVTAMAAQLRVLGRLKGLKRAKGAQGEMKSTRVNGVFRVFMKEDWSDWWLFPSSKYLYRDCLLFLGGDASLLMHCQQI
jgi:cytochrome P450